MILLPGVRSPRTERRSQLSFAWDASDGSLVARTGQRGVLSALTLGAAGAPLVPSVGATIAAGRGQPRFGRLAGVDVLDLSGVTAGNDAEQLTFPFGLLAATLTVRVRLTGLWTAGAVRSTVNYVVGLGGSGAGAGYLRLARGGTGTTTSWVLTRGVGASAAGATLAESAALVWPADVLIQYTQSTGVASLSLRGANGTIYGPVATTGLIGTGRFGSEILGLGSDPTLGAGAPIRLESCQIALGIQSFALMDLLR